MPDNDCSSRQLPIAPIAIFTEQLDPAFSDSVNFHLRARREQECQKLPCLEEIVGYYRSDYRVAADLSRFNSGEGKATILDSIRGHDVFIICDVLNHGKYINRFNRTISISPDEHFMDVLRLIGAIHGNAYRVNVILPYLYESRRYRRQNRSSLDCALVLKTLCNLGVANILTFDAHDSRIGNAVPGHNFESIPTSFQIIETILENYDDINFDDDRFMIISPDEAAVSRGIYYASVLKVPLGIFYRQHNFNAEAGDLEYGNKMYIGEDVKDKDVLLVDDMIDTGATILECSKQLKARGARRVFCAASFAQFTKGFEQVNQAHAEGIIEQVFATNMCYRSPALIDAHWYTDVTMSRYLALIIETMNCDDSLSKLLSPTQRIQKSLCAYKAKQRGE